MKVEGAITRTEGDLANALWGRGPIGRRAGTFQITVLGHYPYGFVLFIKGQVVLVAFQANLDFPARFGFSGQDYTLKLSFEFAEFGFVAADVFGHRTRNFCAVDVQNDQVHRAFSISELERSDVFRVELECSKNHQCGGQ